MPTPASNSHLGTLVAIRRAASHSLVRRNDLRADIAHVNARVARLDDRVYRPAIRMRPIPEQSPTEAP